jgi:ribonuclease HI
MNELLIFTDGSVNTQTKIGYGAYLVVTGPDFPIESLKKQVILKRFENTSSTKLELQTLLWALDEIEATGKKVTVYTDSQNIIGLPRRRERFELNNYLTKKGKRINNYKLYLEFYRIIDQLDLDFVQVRGHRKSNHKDNLDKLFALVDRASRKALRNGPPNKRNF